VRFLLLSAVTVDLQAEDQSAGIQRGRHRRGKREDITVSEQCWSAQ
jgi:hypothetical protein